MHLYLINTFVLFNSRECCNIICSEYGNSAGQISGPEVAGEEEERPTQRPLPMGPLAGGDQGWTHENKSGIGTSRRQSGSRFPELEQDSNEIKINDQRSESTQTYFSLPHYMR